MDQHLHTTGRSATTSTAYAVPQQGHCASVYVGTYTRQPPCQRAKHLYSWGCSLLLRYRFYHLCCAAAASQRSGRCAAAAWTHLITPFLYRAWQAFLATNVERPSAPPLHYPLRSTTCRRHSNPRGSNDASSCRPSQSTDDRRPYSLHKEHKSTSTWLDLRYRPLATASCLLLPSHQGMASTPPRQDPCRNPRVEIRQPARDPGALFCLLRHPGRLQQTSHTV